MLSLLGDCLPVLSVAATTQPHGPCGQIAVLQLPGKPRLGRKTVDGRKAPAWLLRGWLRWLQGTVVHDGLPALLVAQAQAVIPVGPARENMGQLPLADGQQDADGKQEPKSRHLGQP